MLPVIRSPHLSPPLPSPSSRGAILLGGEATAMPLVSVRLCCRRRCVDADDDLLPSLPYVTAEMFCVAVVAEIVASASNKLTNTETISRYIYARVYMRVDFTLKCSAIYAAGVKGTCLLRPFLAVDS